MTQLNPSSSSHSRWWIRPPILIGGVALAAIVMGLPALRGGFVGGDDHGLALDHVLVNRPSLEHALELFTIVHRDLYQPLPLLTFAGEFAIARSLNLFHSGAQSGAWLFHLTNVILHTIVTILAWYTVRMLDVRTPSPSRGEDRSDGEDVRMHMTRRKIVATIAALLFAIHPLNVETVVWINGRMMLLSTLFGLCAILTFARWLDRSRVLDAVLTLSFVILCALSKVRAVLPLLLLLVAMMRGDWRRKRFWPVWVCAIAFTALFTWVNIGATGDLFSEAAENLLGPRPVRVLLALENYFTHVVWPVGLTSYYPTPAVVAWSDPQTFRAVAVTSIAIVFFVFSTWRVPAARWGIAWFFISLGDTLPIFPARNVLAADRYMYLPLVGLFWAIAAVGVYAYDRLPLPEGRRGTRLEEKGPGATPLSQGIAVAILCALVPALIGMSWYTARWYENPQLKTERVARMFPDVPRVWERYGWTLYSLGEYDKVVELAQREFVHDTPAVRSEAYQLIGMCRFKQDRLEEAFEALRKALEVDPENKHGRFRLAKVYEDLGRYADALPLYEGLIEPNSTQNRTLHRLARVYRELGRPADARALYEQELKNNPYEVPATLALADLDFQDGSIESLRAAERRLIELLDWMPENVTARVNLAHLYDTIGDARLAQDQYRQAQEIGFESLEQAVFAHDFHEKKEAFSSLPQSWAGYVDQHPEDATARAFLAWSHLIAGKPKEAREQIASLGTQARTLTMAQATVALLALEDGRDDMVRAMADRLTASPDSPSRQRLLRALERFDNRKPGVAWTYYLTAALLQSEGQPDAARAFLDLFTSHCAGPSCEDARRAIESKRTP